MADSSRDFLLRQFETSWALAQYHLNGLTTEECLWRPATAGPHVWKSESGAWTADWPEHEGYDLGPASIGWLTWHLGFWWSMTLDHAFGAGTLTQEQISWPGDADLVRNWIEGLQRDWLAALQELSDGELQETVRTRWPISGRPFGEIVAWVNVELMKNAAEIGYARFLYAVRTV